MDGRVVPYTVVYLAGAYFVRNFERFKTTPLRTVPCTELLSVA